MDRQRFEELVEAVRQGPVSYRPDLRDDPAKGKACFYASAPKQTRAEHLDELIADAERNKYAWDALKWCAEAHLRTREPMPDILADWLADVLADTLAGRKERRPAKGSSTELKARSIYLAVYHVAQRFGLKPTRNSEPAGGMACAEGGSACDVVGKAFGVGYKAAEAAWLGRDPALSYRKPGKE